MNSYIFSVLFLTFVLVLVPSLGQKSCNMKELDLCGSTYLLQQNLLPTNDREMNRQCDQSKTISKCFSTYAKRCLSPVMSEFFSWIGNNPSQHDHCEDRHGSEARNRLYEKAVCLNTLKRDRDRCVSAQRNAIEHLLEVKYDSKVAAGCCVYRKIESCVNKAVITKCGKEYIDFYRNDIMPATLYDLIETICTGYDNDSDKCKPLLPPIGWEPTPSEDGKKSITSRLMALYFY